jgi:hypothetical protein
LPLGHISNTMRIGEGERAAMVSRRRRFGVVDKGWVGGVLVLLVGVCVRPVGGRFHLV